MTRSATPNKGRGARKAGKTRAARAPQAARDEVKPNVGTIYAVPNYCDTCKRRTYQLLRQCLTCGARV